MDHFNSRTRPEATVTGSLAKFQRLSHADMPEWAVQSCLCGYADGEQVAQLLGQSLPNVTVQEVATLFSVCGWRPRAVASFLTAILRFSELEDVVGEQLLVPMFLPMPRIYCVVLAHFASLTGAEFLATFLRQHKRFSDPDRDYALAALTLIDRRRKVDFVARLFANHDILANIPSRNATLSLEHALNEIRSVQTRYAIPSAG